MSNFESTPDQLAAIEYSDSMVVIATPGSGKTYVVSEKIRGILPDLPAHQGVIAISYTNKASSVLKQRSTRNGINQKGSFFGTIDKFCDGEIIIPFLSQMWGKPTEEITVCKIRSLDAEEKELFATIQTNQVIAVAVGDADQSIFGFSGKDSKYLLSLAKQEGFQSFPVIYNHRCHPSIVNYSQRLLNETSSLLEADGFRVFEKSVQGSHDAVARWIDQALPRLSEKFGIEKNCDFGVLVRTGQSGSLVDGAMQTKHRFFTTHPLEDHFSLWARLFCQLLTFRFDWSVTAQEIVEEASPILSNAEIRKLRRQIRKIRDERQEDLADLFVDVATVLLPNGRSDEVIQLLKDSLAGDLAGSFTPAQEDEVQIMTLHKAKGLEFEVVFHLDMYEWVLPAKRPGPGVDFDNPEYPAWDQDINLHYVGLTRAKEMCVLCTSTRRGALDFNTQVPVERNGQPSEFFNYHGLSELRKG